MSRMVDGLFKVGGYSLPKLLKWVQITAGVPGNAGKDPISHILYLQHAQPDIYRQAYKFLEPIDYVGLRLTGCMAASFDLVTLYWLTDNRDINNVRYDEGLIKISGIDRSKLPDLKPADAVLGTLLPEVARQWGLRDGVRVIMGSPDTHSAAVGARGTRLSGACLHRHIILAGVPPPVQEDRCGHEPGYASIGDSGTLHPGRLTGMRRGLPAIPAR